jgi:hypothetical protein
MKRILFTTLCLMVLLSGCSNDDETAAYSEKQQKALSVFNGSFADYQYSNLGSQPGSNLLGDPDIINFGIQYNEPLELRADDYMDGSKYMGEAHGECVYRKFVVDEYEDIPCYYKVSYDALALTLYRKSNKEQYHHYTLFIDSSTEFRLYQSGLSLPFIFKKQ